MRRTRLAPPAALLALSLFALLPASALRADEGQWPPHVLGSLGGGWWKEMAGRGLTLSASDLWDGKGGGLLTAVAAISGCTASFVSPDGLLVTNHHCAFGAIQLASTPEKNYLRDGFVARSRAEEVPARGGASRVLVLSSITDVTERVRGPKSPFARARTDLDRHRAVERSRKEIVAECERKPDRRCAVAPFFDGLEYRLMEQVELKDVRLVFAPPRAVGDFGGEEDNFRWPRHTGDFAFLRAYVAPDGRPAEHAAANVPYRPKAWIRVSPDGVSDGALVMIGGYPGRTQRYLTASAVENMERWFYPLRSKTFSELIGVLEAEGKADPAVALKVASAVKSYGNAETNARGQVEGLARNRTAEKARAEERELAAFLASKKDLPGELSAAPAELEKLLALEREGQERRFFLAEVERLPGYLGSALSAVRRANERRKPDLDREAGFQDRDLDRAKSREQDLSRTLAPQATRKVLARLVEKAMAAGGAERTRAFDAAFGAEATSASIETALAGWDARTRLSEEAVRLSNLAATADALAAQDDPYVKLAIALEGELATLRQRADERAGALLVWRPRYLSALKALRESRGKAVYPDANGTLRVAFAEVKGYSPREAVLYTPRTTLAGVLQKERGVEPFATPARILEKARARDFGRWADASLGSVPVGFLTNGDTTGGNSGSPTMNGKGELVGLNFDRVWENVAGDFGWSAEVSRNVNVDVRYALWLIDRVEGARGLLEELLGGR